MFRRKFVIAALAATAPLAGKAFADFDIAPAVGPDNKVVTSAFQDSDETFIPNVRVFTYAFGEDPAQPYFLTDPGFHPQPGTSGFAPNALIGVELTEPLRFWSGNGSPSFPTIATSDRIRFEFGASNVTSTGAAVPTPAGFYFVAVDANGEADDHLETYLLASGNDVTMPGTPAAGVYLVTLNVTTDQSGVADSDPVFLLFGNGVDDQTLEAAAVYAHDTFAPEFNVGA